MTPGNIILVLAAVCFVLAWIEGKLQTGLGWQWLGVAFLVIAAIAGATI
jgi:hypothetical protein